jgi:hypothetical protein
MAHGPGPRARSLARKGRKGRTPAPVALPRWQRVTVLALAMLALVVLSVALAMGPHPDGGQTVRPGPPPLARTLAPLLAAPLRGSAAILAPLL